MLLKEAASIVLIVNNVPIIPQEITIGNLFNEDVALDFISPKEGIKFSIIFYFKGTKSTSGRIGALKL
jgi:hypothetical protein